MPYNLHNHNQYNHNYRKSLVLGRKLTHCLMQVALLDKFPVTKAAKQAWAKPMNSLSCLAVYAELHFFAYIFDHKTTLNYFATFRKVG